MTIPRGIVISREGRRTAARLAPFTSPGSRSDSPRVKGRRARSHAHRVVHGKARLPGEERSRIECGLGPRVCGVCCAFIERKT